MLLTRGWDGRFDSAAPGIVAIGHHRNGAFRRFNAIQSRTVSVPLGWDAVIVATPLGRNLDGPGRAFGRSNDSVWQKHHDLPRIVSSVPHSEGQSAIVVLTVFSSRTHFEARDHLRIECNYVVIVRIYDLEIRAVADEPLLYVCRITRLAGCRAQFSEILTARAIRRCACSIKRLAAVAEIESSYFMSILSRLSECSWRQPQ